MKGIVPILFWAVLIAVVLIFFFGGRKNKKKYADRSMEMTKGWYEQSQSLYSSDSARKAYYFGYDKKTALLPGHLMVDRNHQPIYHAEILYGDVLNGYEVDFTNNLIHYQHHHKLGATVTSGAGADDLGMPIHSSFRFDGEDIWDYLKSLGYHYQFHRFGLAYQVDVANGGMPVGTIYSSNGGKNYFGAEGPIQPKMGSSGMYVVECADRDVDAMFLLAMAFARTELSLDNLK